MTYQLALVFEPDTVLVAVSRKGTIAERFAAFDAVNPAVYRALVALTRQAVARGRRRVGIKAVYEVVRWEIGLATMGDDAFRLNNVYTALYAREIMRREPDLAGVFELRERRAA